MENVGEDITTFSAALGLHAAGLAPLLSAGGLV